MLRGAHSIVCCVPPTGRSLVPVTVTPAASAGVVSVGVRA